MCNSVENAARAAVLELAKVLHEAAREAVMKNLVVRRDVPNNGFIEWDQLDDAAREGRIIQARYILNTYAMIPLDNVHACSGCLTLTNAINDMDEFRRLKAQADKELEDERESTDCARRDCKHAQNEASMLRHAVGEVESHLDALENIIKDAVADEKIDSVKVSYLEHELKAHGEYTVVIRTAMNKYDAPRASAAQEVPCDTP